MVIFRFVINRVVRAHYYTDNKSKPFSAYLEQAKTYKTYEEAEKVIDTLPEDFYSIDKVFKVKKT